MSERPLVGGARLAIKHTTRASRVVVDELVSVVDMHTLEDLPAPSELGLNDIGVVRLRLAEPLMVDRYIDNRATGAFILIDEASNDTVAAGMVLEAS
jgi:sulfate adenylyltransferase subunit 1 (EFTu-like GTPase family)